MNRVFALSVAAALGVLLACAPRAAPAQAVQEYEYAENRIYPVRTGLGISTQIELSPNETVIDYSSGFSSGWDISRRDNVFYVRPKNVDVDTNLLIRTETHSYIIELRVVATNWRALDQAKQSGVQYKVTFRYPNDAKFRLESTVGAAAPEAPELSLSIDKSRAYNFNYDYRTKTRLKALIPVNVYDDGRFTYIRLADAAPFPTGSFPAVFARESDGEEEFVVNTTVQGETIVVHGTYGYLVIRHGKEVVGLRRNPRS